MNDLLLFLAAIGVIWAFVLLTYKKFKLGDRGFTLVPSKYPVILMYRTRRGVGVIDRIAARFKNGWIKFGNFAAAVGIFIMFFVFVNVILNAIVLLSRPSLEIPGVTVVLPGLVPGLSVAVWLFAVGVVLVIHELFHGILLRAQGLKTKFVGLMLFLFIPGAFVEPDEEEVRETKPSKRIRMFAAGPMSNVVFAFLFLGLMVALVVPKPGIYVTGVFENYPAENFAENLIGARITSADNVTTNTIEDFNSFTLLKQPGDNITLVTDNGEFPITLGSSTDNENRAVVGILLVSSVPREQFINPLNALGGAVSVILGGPLFHPYTYDAVVPWVVIDGLKWLFALNLLVGFFNLLPAKPLDGGYIFESILEKKVSKKTAKRVALVFSLIVLAFIILNFVPTIMRSLG